jgi:hypothetical protein
VRASAQAATRTRASPAPGADEPACQGGVNARRRALRYGGPARFDGETIIVRFGVSFAVRHTFDDACLEALHGSTITLGGRATGRFCVGDDALVIDFDPRGPEGWSSWLFYR